MCPTRWGNGMKKDRKSVINIVLMILLALMGLAVLAAGVYYAIVFLFVSAI